ncbi:hypothetical protein STCU_07075 [Strigomonas culicis]|uniref:Uncharacterized protein n=1 Tax=Strigomonas culicis TaxID=28005 RepID=S9U6Y6_9TRYP|nr:hypothetical protein STCU_07075 [Strigomonas culicis]|eukprot:EPY24648.1 hypothetical protein STCU_07075 [Strigomonas culicis]
MYMYKMTIKQQQRDAPASTKDSFHSCTHWVGMLGFNDTAHTRCTKRPGRQMTAPLVELPEEKLGLLLHRLRAPPRDDDALQTRHDEVLAAGPEEIGETDEEHGRRRHHKAGNRKGELLRVERDGHHRLAHCADQNLVALRRAVQTRRAQHPPAEDVPGVPIRPPVHLRRLERLRGETATFRRCRRRGGGSPRRRLLRARRGVAVPQTGAEGGNIQVLPRPFGLRNGRDGRGAAREHQGRLMPLFEGDHLLDIVDKLRDGRVAVDGAQHHHAPDAVQYHERRGRTRRILHVSRRGAFASVPVSSPQHGLHHPRPHLGRPAHMPGVHEAQIRDGACKPLRQRARAVPQHVHPSVGRADHSQGARAALGGLRRRAPPTLDRKGADRMALRNAPAPGLHLLGAGVSGAQDVAVRCRWSGTAPGQDKRERALVLVVVEGGRAAVRRTPAAEGDEPLAPLHVQLAGLGAVARAGGVAVGLPRQGAGAAREQHRAAHGRGRGVGARPGLATRLASPGPAAGRGAEAAAQGRHLAPAAGRPPRRHAIGRAQYHPPRDRVGATVFRGRVVPRRRQRAVVKESQHVLLRLDLYDVPHESHSELKGADGGVERAHEGEEQQGDVVCAVLVTPGDEHGGRVVVQLAWRHLSASVQEERLEADVPRGDGVGRRGEGAAVRQLVVARHERILAPLRNMPRPCRCRVRRRNSPETTARQSSSRREGF